MGYVVETFYDQLSAEVFLLAGAMVGAWWDPGAALTWVITMEWWPVIPLIFGCLVPVLEIRVN